MKRFKEWLVHKCGGIFPYEQECKIVKVARPVIHLKNSRLIDAYQYQSQPDYAVGITEKELAREIGETMRNNGYITYSYELVHYGYVVTAEAYIAGKEENVV